MNELRVAALQMELKHKAVEANCTHLLELLEEFDLDSHLLVLPEMWTTGFITRIAELPESLLGSAYEEGRAAMHHVAKQYNCAVYGTLIQLRPNGKPTNTGLFVTPEGQEIRYFKKHLFAFGGEAKHFASGDERVQMTYEGWQIRLSTCYDLRFPVWLRQDTRLGFYDLLLCSANWPAPRQAAWERLLRARAIENQCYLVACNRVGTPHPKLYYPGYSFVLDAEGDTLSSALESREALLTATLSMEKLSEMRSNFPLLEDADSFQLL